MGNGIKMLRSGKVWDGNWGERKNGAHFLDDPQERALRGGWYPIS